MLNFKDLEAKWQKKWEESRIFEVKENSKKKKLRLIQSLKTQLTYSLKNRLLLKRAMSAFNNLSRSAL